MPLRAGFFDERWNNTRSVGNVHKSLTAGEGNFNRINFDKFETIEGAEHERKTNEARESDPSFRVASFLRHGDFFSMLRYSARSSLLGRQRRQGTFACRFVNNVDLGTIDRGEMSVSPVSFFYTSSKIKEKKKKKKEERKESISRSLHSIHFAPESSNVSSNDDWRTGTETGAAFHDEKQESEII